MVLKNSGIKKEIPEFSLSSSSISSGEPQQQDFSEYAPESSRENDESGSDWHNRAQNRDQRNQGQNDCNTAVYWNLVML